MNDLAIFFGILLLFVAIGALIPQVADELGSSYRVNSTLTNITSDFGSSWDDSSAWTKFKSISSMFFWTFGAIWWPIDLLIFVPLRIVLFVILVRWVRGVAS